MLKKVTIIMIALVMILGIMLTGCSSSKSASSKKTQVVLHTISGPDPTGRNQKLNDEFEKETGIKVLTDTVPYGQDTQKLINSLSSKKGTYDMFVMDVIYVSEYVSAGWVQQIDDKITPAMKADLLPFSKNAVTYKGHWYGLPTENEFKSFVYNKVILAKAGIQNPPTTWDEFIQDEKLIQQKGLCKYPTAWSWTQGESLVCDFAAINATFGGKFFDKNNNPIFDQQGSVNALQFMCDQLNKYKVANPASLSWSESDVSNAMSAGDIAFELSWGLPLVPLNNKAQSKIVGQGELSLMPHEGNNPPATVSGPMAWAIAKNSTHKDAAWQYINFLVGKGGGAKREAIEAGNAPGWKSLYSDPAVLKAIPSLKQQLKQAAYAINRPQVPWYSQFSDELSKEIQNALTKQKTPKQALNDAVKATKALETQTN